MHCILKRRLQSWVKHGNFFPAVPVSVYAGFSYFSSSPDVSSLCWPGEKSSASCGLWHLLKAHRAVSLWFPLFCQAPHYQHPVQLQKCPVLISSCNNFSVLVHSVSPATCVTQWDTEENKMSIPSPGRKPLAVFSLASFSCFSLFIFSPLHTLEAWQWHSQIKGV